MRVAGTMPLFAPYLRCNQRVSLDDKLPSSREKRANRGKNQGISGVHGLVEHNIQYEKILSGTPHSVRGIIMRFAHLVT